MYKHTIEIKEFNNWLIIKVLDYGPKIKYIGTGLLFSDFNKNDLLISQEALNILSNNLGKINNEIPVLEIINFDKIFWQSDKGIIIPPNEIIHVYTIPYFTLCNNNIDDKIIEIINNKKK